MGKDTIRDDMQWRTFYQPGVAVNACPFIPPAFLGIGIYTYGNGIHIVTICCIRRDVDIHGCITAPVAMQYGSVNPDRGMCGNTVEL